MKKIVIIISASVIALAVAIPISVKNIRSHVQYVDSFGSDTMQEAVERTIEYNSYKEQIMGIYPQKALEDRYGKKWWENPKYLEIEQKVMIPVIKYGRHREYRYFEIDEKRKSDSKDLEDDLDFKNIYNAGLKVEEVYNLILSYDVRGRYDFDAESEEQIPLEYLPAGEWSEWKRIYNQTYIAYKVAGKWYCRYWGE